MLKLAVFFTFISISVAALFGIPSVAVDGKDNDMDDLLLDDFTSDTSKIGTRWEGFSDQVMGGVSEIRLGIQSESGVRYLALAGTVSLANRGGFIQARLLLRKGNGPFDASGYSGIRLIARGTGEGYYIFLRTTATVFPWAFYMAPIEVGEEWREIRIPWSSFVKGDFGAAFDMNVKRLRSVAVTAYKKEFTARLHVREIGLYR